MSEREREAPEAADEAYNATPGIFGGHHHGRLTKACRAYHAMLASPAESSGDDGLGPRLDTIDLVAQALAKWDGVEWPTDRESYRDGAMAAIDALSWSEGVIRRLWLRELYALVETTTDECYQPGASLAEGMTAEQAHLVGYKRGRTKEAKSIASAMGAIDHPSLIEAGASSLPPDTVERDAERWRAFADGWEYRDLGGQVVTLEQQCIWLRADAPGSEDAAIEAVVASYRARLFGRGSS